MEDDGRTVNCVICDAPCHRSELKRHEAACAAIEDALERIYQEVAAAEEAKLWQKS